MFRNSNLNIQKFPLYIIKQTPSYVTNAAPAAPTFTYCNILYKTKHSSMSKPIILLAVGIAISGVAVAQTREVKQDQKVLQNTVKDKKEDNKEANNDMAHFRVRSSMQERREVRRHKRSMIRQAAHLKRHGRKHPIRDAQREIREEKEMKH